MRRKLVGLRVKNRGPGLAVLRWAKGTLPSRPRELPSEGPGRRPKSRACPELPAPSEASSNGRRGLRGPRASGVPGRAPRSRPPGSATSTHQLPPLGFHSGTSAARPPAFLSSTRGLPPACGGPGRRAAGSGVGGRAEERARAARLRDAGGGRPLSSRGHVNALHLGRESGWGSFLWAPRASSTLGGSDRPAALPARARAASGSGAGWGPGQGVGSQGSPARHWLIFYSVDMFSYC